MPITAKTLRDLADMDATADQLRAMLRIFANEVEVTEKGRERAAARKRKSRAAAVPVTVTGQSQGQARDGHRDSPVTVTVTDRVQMRDGHSDPLSPPPLEKFPPVPPSKDTLPPLTPGTPSPTAKSLSAAPTAAGKSVYGMPDLWEAIDGYNAVAHDVGWPKVITTADLSKARREKLRARLKQAGGVAAFIHFIEGVKTSNFLNGDNDRGWKADFDFFLQEKSFTKVMEGSYDRSEGRGHHRGANGANTTEAGFHGELAAYAANGAGLDRGQADPAGGDEADIDAGEGSPPPVGAA